MNCISTSLPLPVFPNDPPYPLQGSRDGEELGALDGNLLGRRVGDEDGLRVGNSLGLEEGSPVR